MRDPPLSPLRTPLLPPPENSRWGYRERGVDYSTYLVRHHHASIWLCNFITACMEAAWMHPHASLPETFSLRERLSNWILMGFCAGQLRGGVQRGVRQPLRQAPQLVLAASKQHQLRLLLQQHLRSFCSTRPLLAASMQFIAQLLGQQHLRSFLQHAPAFSNQHASITLWLPPMRSSGRRARSPAATSSLTTTRS